MAPTQTTVGATGSSECRFIDISPARDTDFVCASANKLMKKTTYGQGVAAENASKREKDVLKILESSNKLRIFAPFVCGFSVITFIGWCFIWSQYTDIILYCLNITSVDSTCSKQTIDFDNELFQYVSLVTSSILFSSFISQVLQIFDYDVRNSFRITAVYCTAVINLIATAAHYSMAKGWFPTVISIFGRVNHVARWGEWVSLVPLLMVMMNSIDIRDSSDTRLLVEASLCQLFSVVFGGVSSLSPNRPLAIVLMIVSCLLYLHIFYVLWRALHRYNGLLRDNSKDTNSTSIEGNLNQAESLSTKDVIAELELMTATLSVKLAIACTITWTIKVALYGLGVMNVISQTQEAIFQSVMDCVSKGLYARTLCTSHGTAMSPEGLLRKMLFIEEQANASIRQVKAYSRIIYTLLYWNFCSFCVSFIMKLRHR